MGTDFSWGFGVVYTVVGLSVALSCAVVLFKWRRTHIEKVSLHRQRSLLESWSSRSGDLIEQALRTIASGGVLAVSDLAAALRSGRAPHSWDSQLTGLVETAIESTGLRARLDGFLRSRIATRRGIAVVLGGYPPTRVSAAVLGGFLADDNPTVRLAAAASLGRLATPAAATVLIAGLENAELPAPRIIERLGRDWAVPTIIDVLLSGGTTGEVRTYLLRALAQSGDHRAIPLGLAAAGDGDEEERVQALRLLSACIAHADDEQLIEMGGAAAAALESPHAAVRNSAVQLLSASRTLDREELLVAFTRDPDWFVRRTAARALSECGPSGVQRLRELSQGDDPFAAERAREELDRLEAAPSQRVQR